VSENLVTLGDASRALQLPYGTVWAAYSKGRIPFTRAGSAILVTVEAVQAAMADYRPRGKSNPTLRTAVTH
jgi:hypothetical protein